MDYGGESQKVEGPWIPATPEKAVLPKPQVIYTDFLGNQLGPANGLQSEEFLFGLTPEVRAEYANLCCNRTNCNWEAALDAKACSSSIGYFEASKQFSFSNLIGDANNVSCSSLLALAEAANDASGASKQFTDTNSHKEPNWGSAVTYATTTSASAFAPVTPAKATGVDCNELTETPYLCLDERTYHERNKQIELEAAVIDTIVLQADKKIQNPATDSASTAISATYKENTGNLIDLNKTPQQKPRRKKHRPKVIIEGKSKKTPKPVTPKPPASEEKPAVKRKYVRRDTLNKAPATPQTEANGQFNDPKMQELPRKSSRRALNFDIGGQTREEAPRCNATSDLDADQQKQASVTGKQPKSTVHLGHGIELFVENSRATSDLDAGQQKQASVAGNQPKSTVHLGQGIEVFVENSQAGIAYDFNRTVNQMLKDYITLPEKQVPSTPIPTQTDPKEANSTGKEGVTAHNVKESAIQIMLQASSQLSPTIQNGCTYSTSTMSTEVGLVKGLKRKTSSVNEPPDTCSTNLLGFQYSALPTYQILSLEQFPGFCKKKRSEKGQGSVTSSVPSLVTAAVNKQMLQTTRYFPSIRDPSSSRVNYCIPVPERNCGCQGARREENGSPHHKQQILSCVMSQTDRSTKKRSRGHTRVGDLASLSRLVGCMRDPTNPARRVQVNCNGQQIGSTQPPKTVEEEVAKMCPKTTTKKRTVKRNTVASALSCSNEGQSNGQIVLFKHNMYSGKLLGTSYGNFNFRPGTSPETMSQLVDAITKQLKNLDINRNNSAALVLYGRDHMNSTSSNALIPYGRDGTVIPFDGSFEFIKKRPPRPKVDLDEETTRVWKLLLENINNEGIDGTDDEKAKWWEEERRVFRGRTESFIARMHLVQGDRRFSPWKGSVVDSVVGVFLTQNVSDHLSSSAFMSLASHFPFKSESIYEPCREEKGSSEIREPIVSVSDPEENVTWTLEMSNTTICDQSSMNRRGVELDEEREVVNSNESPGSSTGISSIETGLETYYESTANESTIEKVETIKVCYIDEERTAINDALSSQNSVVSSQISEDSPLPETAERKGSCLENNAELDNMACGSSLKKLNGTFSFMELLQNVGQRNGKTSPDHNSKGECCKTQSEGNDFQRRNADCLDCCTILSGLPVASNLNDLEGGCVEMITAGTRYSSTTKKVENNMKDHSAPVGEYSGQIAQQNKSAAESSGQLTVENKVTKSVQEASRSPTSNNSSCNSVQGGHLTRQFQSTLIEEFERSLAQEQNTEVLQNLSGEIIHPVESTSGYDRQGKNPQKMTESDLVEHASQMKELDAKRKAKSRRVGRELKDNVNWDALRKEAEADGRKREKTKNAMDSLDWEAVRCADVNEIANTIKERGMNNMLAERIKAFLNRLVREHGSIDLEWLRDVPPDEAKEYLLSIRGLGLKSVECVRLLTLHHLAFPVDTNVGRIAVRLGWVPLQPLPESLQLHLLELYPVLESIQKYLWPRLCKLDQRTLYELHYQMITFGKVFCTKNKPNCNACPMRGECRHFASAFASARLALPGPEEKSIVGVPANRTTDQTPPIMANPLPLPPPLPPVTKESGKNQLTEAYQVSVLKWQDHNCEPIIEVPLSPEPELTQVTEIDIEDTFCEDPDEIPTIKLNIEQFTQNVQSYMQHNMDLQEHEMSKALVALTAEAASIPTPKLKNVSRLRTEHQVYELPDSHPLLQGLEQRELDDPCSYLLAIWTPGETANSIQPPSAEGMCTSQQEGKFCCEKTCFSCNSIREENSQIVRGTLLIPCRTAMRGSFPLNGTYFQVNEVFADHDSSQNPIEVPRAWIWNLQRRTVYFGTSVPTIFKGLTTEEIQHCFWRGFVCVRGFDQKTRAPRPLIARLHFPASKLKANRTAGEEADDEQAK